MENMNKEEKEAIEYIKAFQKDLYGASEKNLMAIYIDRVWNYINKLQKENEDMREELQMYVDTDVMILQEKLKSKEKQIKLMQKMNLPDEIEKSYVSKDKIKEALGDKNIPDEMILTYIETLVSENNRLEDIEDRKVQIEYNNVFNKGVKSVEDKIRTKIEELEEKCEAIRKTYKGTYALNGNYLEAFSQIVILKELLGDDE